MSSTPVCNITTYTDEDFKKVFVYKANGVPINLTGAAMYMGVRRHVSDHIETLLMTNDPGGGIEIVDGANGKFTLLITKEQLARITPAEYVQSMIWQPPGGYRTAVWRGTMTHNEGPSR